MVRVLTDREPTHPGEMLLEEFLDPSTTLRLSKFLGTSTGFWMNVQARWDLYHARRDEEEELTKIPEYGSRRRGGI